MYFALGVLTTGLLALTVTPAIWRRASRLTRARLESSLPISLAEIQADRDQLRAGYAIGTRRLEVNVDRLEKRVAEQLVEINRRREEAARLTSEKAGHDELIRGLEGRIAILGNEFKGNDDRLADANTELASREASLSERARSLAAKEAELTTALQVTEEQKLELIARATEVGNLRDQLATAKASEASVSEARDTHASRADEQSTKADEERKRAAALATRVAALEEERIDRLAALERRATELRELEAEIAAERSRRDALTVELTRLTAERDVQLATLAANTAEIGRLKAELDKAMQDRTATDERIAAAHPASTAAAADATGASAAEAPAVIHLPGPVAAAPAPTPVPSAENDNLRQAVAASEAERIALATRLASLEEEHAALKSQNAELHRVAGVDWEIERAENRRVRERLNEIAGGIMKLAATTTNGQTPAAPLAEGQNGQRDLAQPPAHPAAPTVVASNEEPAQPPARQVQGKTLAERIRALQHSTSARH